MADTEREWLARYVVLAMDRLSSDPESWLPGSLTVYPGDRIDVTFTIHLEDRRLQQVMAEDIGLQAERARDRLIAIADELAERT